MKFEKFYLDKLKDYPKLRLFNYSLINNYIKNKNYYFNKDWVGLLNKQLSNTEYSLYPNKYFYNCCSIILEPGEISSLSLLCIIAFNKSCKKIQKFLNIREHIFINIFEKKLNKYSFLQTSTKFYLINNY